MLVVSPFMKLNLIFIKKLDLSISDIMPGKKIARNLVLEKTKFSFRFLEMLLNYPFACNFKTICKICSELHF